VLAAVAEELVTTWVQRNTSASAWGNYCSTLSFCCASFLPLNTWCDVARNVLLMVLQIGLILRHPLIAA